MIAKFAILVTLLAFIAMVNADLLHAECNVKWTVGASCKSAQEKIVNQMNEWNNAACGTKPGDWIPHGQKCLYKHTKDEGMTTYGTHTTPIHKFVDDLTYVFEDQGSGCLVKAKSKSRPLSKLDFGTNYCNLFNLMDGSGLTKDPGYTEETSNSICTQRSSANCEKY